MTTTDPGLRRIDYVMRAVGLAALVAVAVFPFAATGLVAPLWAVAIAWGAWSITAVVTWRIARRRPRFTPFVPVAAAAAWYLLLIAAAEAFGWTRSRDRGRHRPPAIVRSHA